MKKIFLTTLIFTTIAIYSGDLDDFEKGILDSNRQDNYDDTYESSNDSDGNNACGEAIGAVAGQMIGACLQLTGAAMVYGGVLSYHKTTGEENEIKRDKGTFLIPHVRVDNNFCYYDLDIYSLNNRIELGYGPIALAANINIYKEKDPNDKLNIIDGTLLYRMSFPRYVEVDISMGISAMLGNHSTYGFKTGLPIRIKPTEQWGIELRPEVVFLGHIALADLDFSIYWGVKHFGFTAGYKHYGFENFTKSGPYIGVRTLY